MSVKHFDYYYIQKKAFTAPIYHTTQESERIQARLKWKKIELFNEYNKIDFSPKVKESEFSDGFGCASLTCWCSLNNDRIQSDTVHKFT